MVSLVLSNSLGSLVSLWPQSSLCRAFLWLGLHWPSKKRTKKEKRQRGMVSGFGGWHHHWLQWWVPLPHGFGSCRQILSLPLDHRGLEHRREARRERRGKGKENRRGRENRSISPYLRLQFTLLMPEPKRYLQELFGLYPGSHFWCAAFRLWMG